MRCRRKYLWCSSGFLAGFLPGGVVMLLYSGYIAVWSLLNPSKQPPPEPRMGSMQNVSDLPA